ncbi:hypothetical protein [Nocardia rhizosphaerihabitans]|nr:hypothetical protein [Nocardia rhizosphaerihabitans]
MTSAQPRQTAETDTAAGIAQPSDSILAIGPAEFERAVVSGIAARFSRFGASLWVLPPARKGRPLLSLDTALLRGTHPTADVRRAEASFHEWNQR